jgi:hypothetical protein
MKVIDRQSTGGHVIFCDDIRHEITGKVSLIGAYAGIMFVQGNFPVTLPKLCVRITYWEKKGESDEPVELRIYFPGNKMDAPSLKADLGLDFRAKAAEGPSPALEDGESEADRVRFLTALMHVELTNLEIPQEGLIRVRAFRGDSIVKLGALVIAPHPNANMAMFVAPQPPTEPA